MKRAPLLILACLVTITNSTAAGVADDARFALHLKEPAAKSAVICTTYTPNATGIPCSLYITTGSLFAPSLVYLVLGHGPTLGISGGSLGIDYNPQAGAGIDVQDWILCATGLQFPHAGPNGPWPAAGAGNCITWVDCETTIIGGDGVHAVLGALECYAYTADQLSITPNVVSSGPELKIATCDGATTDLLKVFPPFAWYALMGRVDFGGGAGLNPCLIVPTRQTTWGKIKAGYQQ